MKIKLWDYLEEYEVERAEILEGVEKVFRSGYLILGDSLKQFEAAFSSYCQIRYGVGVDNGTNAIFLALKALCIGAGDEVITVSNTAVPTVSAIVSTGATPRFVDIEPQTYHMEPKLLRSAINKKTKCIIPVHLFGQCVDLDPVMEIAKEYNLKVVEDCAQSHGATYKGRKAGSMGLAGTFSFYPTKPLGGYGDGGMVVTDDEEIDKKLRRLRFYGMEGIYYAEEHGYNSRLDELQAEILLRKLNHLDTYIIKRGELARRYDEILKGTSLVTPTTREGNEHVYYLYVCRHPERDRIITALKQKNIFVNISYPWPIHMMRGYSYLGYKEGDLPETEHAAKEIFSLPMYPMLSYEAQDKVCHALGEILGEKVNL